MTSNILFVSHSAELNGAERMLLQILKSIDREKYHPYLLLPEPGPLGAEAKKIGVEEEIVPFKWWITEKSKTWKQPFSWLWNIGSVFRLLGILERRQISLVFSNSSVGFSGAFAAKMKRIPHIWSIHEILGDENPLLHFFFGNRVLVRLISWLSTRIIVNSSASQKAFKNKRKVQLVYNGIEISHKNELSEELLRREFGLLENDFVLGVVGKIYKEKGQREVILALGSLRRTRPQVKLLLVGDVKEQDYYHELERLVEDLDLEHHVFFTGYRGNILELLRLMDLLVVASSVDSFGLAALEAMSVRTPVLAVSAGGLPEIISPGENGFLVESSDPELIRKAVESLCQNPSRMNEVAEKGFQTAGERFSSEEQIKKIQKVMEECLE